MATTTFYLREPKADKETPIYLRLNDTVNGSVLRVKFPTGEKIHPKFWDTPKQKVKGTGSPELNDYLKDLAKKVENVFRKFITDGIVPTPEMLRQAIAPEKITAPIDQNKYFFDTLSKFIEVQAEFQHERTIKKYKGLVISLQAFEKAIRQSLSFDTIDLSFYESYKIFLLKQSTGRYVEKGLVNDTIAKYISTLKTFLSWSLDRKYHANIEFKQFKATRKPKNEIVTLSEEELLTIYKYDFSKDKRLERVRDLFCFGCFTGQRWSDVEAFNAENIKDRIWDFISIKTKKQTRVPLVGFSASALDVLEKYEYKLPVISSQKFNDYLKEVGEKAGINSEVVIKRYSGKKIIEVRKPKFQFMSSHMARRSFVTILLQKGIPPTTIMKLTGHTDLKTLMKYENTSHEATILALERTSKITI